MSDLPVPSPLLPMVVESQVREILVGLEPGWYRTQDLYPRYEAFVNSKGQRVALRRELGQTLARVLGRGARRVHGNVAAFHVTEDYTRASTPPVG